MNTETSTSKTNTTIDRLFQVGAHFGFTKRRRHPTVVPYLYGTKDGNDIFDLTQTAEQLEQAASLIEEYAKLGKTIMYVGTKTEIKDVVESSANTVGAPYVVNRWIGGTLTNFSEIKKRLKRLNDLEAEQAAGTLDRKYTKRERVMIGREMTRLRFNFGGMQKMERLPDLMVVVDPRHETIAVEEATLLGIPTVGIMSSDGNVQSVTHPVIMNDALNACVSLALEEFTSAHQRGVSAYTPAPAASAETARPRGATTRA